MSQVTLTMTFATADEALAFLAGKSTSAPAKTAAPKTETAAASKPSAESKPEPVAQEKSADVNLDFDKDVLPALQAYAKRVPREKFAELMKKVGAAKVPEIKEKPETWADIVNTCNAA